MNFFPAPSFLHIPEGICIECHKECDGKMKIMENHPTASAKIAGSAKYPHLRGRVDFYDTFGGTVLVASIYGITDINGKSSQQFHGFHIHEGGSCSGTDQEPFANVDGHYQSVKSQHPEHAGDLPPLLSNNGIAWMCVYTDRFYPEDVIGKTVIIHALPDDFHTQPSGASGEMIACGEIQARESEIR